MSWVDGLALRKDETVVDSWHGIREIIETFDIPPELHTENKKKLKVKDRKEGILVLTNQRLLFLEGRDIQEPPEKKLSESIRVSLIDVDQVLFEKAPIESVKKVEGVETYIFSLKRVGKKKEFRAFKKLVDEHCQKRREQLEAKTKKTTEKAINFKIT
jgi:hypothetical protein